MLAAESELGGRNWAWRTGRNATADGPHVMEPLMESCGWRAEQITVNDCRPPSTPRPDFRLFSTLPAERSVKRSGRVSIKRCVMGVWP